MNYSEIAFKLINSVLKIKAGQSVTVSSEIHNVFDFDETLAEIPFLEEIVLVIRKHKGLPVIDISTENLHKRFFEEISEDYHSISMQLFNKWIDNSDFFIDLSWRSNPIFYKSIPERSYKRLKLNPYDFIKIFEEKNKKLILLGYPTKGLAKYYDIDYEVLKNNYFSALNVNYNDLKKRCLILDGKMKKSKSWYISTEKRTLQLELAKNSKCSFGDFNEDSIMIFPIGYWQQEIEMKSLNGIFYCDQVYYEQYNWKNIQIIFEDGKICDVETDLDQNNINLLKSVLFFDHSSVSLNIGLNNLITDKTLYSLFDMTKNKNLSLVINHEKGQLIALSENASLFQSNENNVLNEV